VFCSCRRELSLVWLGKNNRRLPTKADAQAWLSGVETDIRRGTWLDPEGSKVTLASWLQHGLKTVVDGHVGSDNTRANYAQIIRVHIAPALGMVTLSELTAEMVDKFLAAKAAEGQAALYAPLVHPGRGQGRHQGRSG
jgi:hypothetical protein